MTFWDWLHRIGPGWPTERQAVTAAIVATLWIMLQMAVNNPRLWDVKLFEILIQGFALTGMLNMILAFHFAANKGDETKADNTGKMADAMRAVAENAKTDTPQPVVVTNDAGDPVPVEQRP